MEPWYKVVTPRKEVREGRSFNPDEFAIALEQVVAGTAPDDYRQPAQFFARTCFTRALLEHAGMVLRRLAGKTENTAPVLTLITQFGGGKTHTLAALYHLARAGKGAAKYTGVPSLIQSASLSAVPQARVAVFVGNAWDPREGRESPWIDVAQQLAGKEGISALGETARTTPPGTESLARLFGAAGGCVLILFDEVLNFMNRHRAMAESFHAFIQNLTVAMTGTPKGAAVVSLPRSQVEVTDWDLQWQERITKVVRRVAKDLIANDETEISEVVRRRLFEDLGSERTRKNVAKAYADWCFERRAQLPPEWTAVDTAATEKKAREYLQSRFETCYPFHPATLSVFQRKWQALPQYQQTRGTLAMLAQWIAWAYREAFAQARTEPLITLGSAPLQVPEFRSVVLGQLGEARLVAAIDADISGEQAHSRSLDADTKGPLRNIHRRVGTTILFESSGGQVDKVAHLPELRFALGEPDLDTTSIDNGALALEAKAFFIRKVGSDGFQIRHQPTLKKVVNDRRASLDEQTDIKPTMRGLVKKELERGASVPIVPWILPGLRLS
jgi:predicted AAA+ superfamily ATPase